MKKSLSLLVAIAMVISMFASVASAATTTQEKFDQLKQAGIFNGYPDGTAGLDKEMTRAEFAKVLALVTESGETGSATYTDVAATHWAAGYIAAVTDAGLMEGQGAGVFAPNGKVTVQELATTLVRAAGIEPGGEVSGTVAAWAKPYVAAAVANGLIPEAASYTGNALRSLLVDSTFVVWEAGQIRVTETEIVDAKNIKVTFSDGETVDVELEEALAPDTATRVTVEHNGKQYTVTVTYEGLGASVKQTDDGELTVTFNRALEADEKDDMTFELASDLVKYTTKAEWAKDNKSVVLTSNFLPAGDYTLKMTDLDPINVKVEEGKAVKIEIKATSLQQAEDQSAKEVVTNQFGKEMDNIDVDVRVFNVTKGEDVEVDGDNEFDLSVEDNDGDYIHEVGDSIIVTAIYAEGGLTTSKTFSLVAGSAATRLVFGQVEPLEDETRVEINQNGLVLPYTFTDQYGTEIELPESSEDLVRGRVDIGGITFIVSDDEIITALEVDDDGELTFSTGEKSGTVIINAINPATGATGSTSIVVYNSGGAGSIEKFQMSRPSEVIVRDEEIKIPFVAIDEYGEEVDPKDIKVDDHVEFRSSLDVVDGYPKINGKGELLFKFEEDGTGYIYAIVEGREVGRVSVSVREVAELKKLAEVKDVPQYFTVGATADFDTDNVLTVDNYNRTKEISALTTDNVTITSGADVISFVAGNDGTITKIQADKIGKATITIKHPTQNLSELKYNIEVIDADDVSSYSIKKIGKDDTLYAGTSKHDKEVKLAGVYKGKEVALASGVLDFVTSDKTTVVAANNDKTVSGIEAGEATITAYNVDGDVLATKKLKVSEAAPVVDKVEFDEDEYTVAVGGTFTFDWDDIKIKDQYDVNFEPSSFRLISSDSSIVSANSNSLTITGVKKGSVTLTFRASNGVTATTSIIVD